MKNSSSWKRSAAVVLAHVALVSATCASGCGGDVAIGKGTSALDGNDGSTVGSDPAGHCRGGACAPPQSGDCPMAKCADYSTGCAYGSMVHLRCVPSPNRGVGSAPADQCYLIGDCTNERFPTDGGTCPVAQCEQEPTCAFGTPSNLACIKIGEGSGGAAQCAWNFVCQ